MTRFTRTAVLATAMSGLLVGCGGGGDLEAFTAPLNGGIWHGTDSISGQQVYGIVAEGGAFVFIRADGVQYSGDASFDKRAVTGTFEGFVPLGFVFDDGSVHGTGSVSGVLQSQRTMDLAVTFITDAVGAVPDNGVVNLTYDKLYERASSPFTVAGTYGTGGNAVLSVTTGGTIAGQNADGCIITGTITPDEPAHNVYKITLDYANCGGASTVLNAQSLEGLATLDSSTAPERLVGGVSTGTVGVTFSLNRM